MEVLQYSIPALVVFATTFIMIFLHFRNEDKKRKVEIHSKSLDVVLPLRLQAYERIILLLERITPANLIIRVQHPGMNVSQLQSELLATIRQEFEHNISQQMYISSELWRKVTETKENLVKRINTSVIELKPGSPSIELIKELLEGQIENDVTSTTYAIELVKKELRQLF